MSVLSKENRHNLSKKAELVTVREKKAEAQRNHGKKRFCRRRQCRRVAEVVIVVTAQPARRGAGRRRLLRFELLLQHKRELALGNLL